MPQPTDAAKDAQPTPGPVRPKPSYEDLEAQVLEDDILIRGLRDRNRRLRQEIQHMGKVIAVLEGQLTGGRTDKERPSPPGTGQEPDGAS